MEDIVGVFNKIHGAAGDPEEIQNESTEHLEGDRTGYGLTRLLTFVKRYLPAPPSPPLVEKDGKLNGVASVKRV